MTRSIRAIAIAVGVSTAGSAGQAQTMFTGAGCSGNTFLFCASWTGTYIDATHIQLAVTNTSQNAPANNSLSAFTRIALGNVLLSDPASMTPVIGWQFETSATEFNGLGLLANQFGASSISNAVVDGSSILLQFNFNFGIGQFEDANAAFSGAQIAIQDGGYRVEGCVSRGVMQGNATGQNTSSFTACDNGMTTVPEPSTYALMAAGLAGLLGAARSRRAARI
jgi:hypothetical protein